MALGEKGPGEARPREDGTRNGDSDVNSDAGDDDTLDPGGTQAGDLTGRE